jgi:EAL domain-containing protein (putative c-di-GMP-specific phosphodiesterase class I)
MAEDIGLIREIGRLILGGACRQMRIWHERFPALRPNITVNVSGRQLTDPAFINIVEATLAHAHLDPSSLVVEVTESVLTSGSARARAALGELRAQGVRIAIDDFGTGYSSLSGLSDVPVDMLKIDKRFVSELLEDRHGLGVMQAILLLARTYELRTVAEGVERVEEQQLLVELGCDSLQGYLFGRPMPGPDASVYLEACSKSITGPRALLTAPGKATFSGRNAEVLRRP